MICTYNPFGGDLIFSWVPTLYLKRSRWFLFWNLSKKFIERKCEFKSETQPICHISSSSKCNQTRMKSETFIEHLQNQNSDPNASLCPQPQMKSLQTGKQVCERRGTYSSRSMGFEIRCVCCCHYYSVVEKKKTSPLGCYEILLAQWNPGRLRVELQSKNTWENWGWLQSAEQ